MATKRIKRKKKPGFRRKNPVLEGKKRFFTYGLDRVFIPLRKLSVCRWGDETGFYGRVPM
jgi:hypothetical protein